MLITELAVNDVLESLTDDTPLQKLTRILWIDAPNGVYTVISIEDEPKKPFQLATAELATLLLAGAVRKTRFRTPAHMLKIEEDIPAGAAAIRDKNWERIQPLVESRLLGEIFMPNALGAMVAARAKEIGVERKSLFRSLYRYWVYGQTRNALLPNYDASGALGKARVFVKGKRPGRPLRHADLASESAGKILGDDDKRFIKIGYALYKKDDAPSIVAAYHKTLRRFYVDEHGDARGGGDDLTLKPLNEIPSLPQFRYWGRKAFSDLEVLRGRKGEKKWLKDHRGLQGRATDGVYGPCHRFEIDATIADIYLVSRFNRHWIIGRPVVYVVVDVFSALIVGLFVGLEGPSWNGARHALFNAFTDKQAYCAAHGVEIRPEEWPCHHLPQEIMADRGEMLGAAAEGMVAGLHINLAIAPSFRPDWKSVVESRFRLLNNVSQIRWIPGGVRERIKERGQRDYRLDATLDLSEFTNIIIRSVLHYNRTSRHPERLTAEMIAQDVNPTPLQIWSWGLSNGLGTPNAQSEELVYLHLLPRDSATVQRNGIHFKGMRYTCSEAIQADWFAQARKSGRRSLQAWFNPDSTEHIWIQNERRDFIRCDLLPSEERYRHHRLEEVLDMLEMTSQAPPGETYAVLNDKINLDSQIEAIVNDARKLTEKAVLDAGLSGAQRLTSIKEHRAVERKVEQVRSTEGAPLATLPQRPPAPVSPQSVAADAYAGPRGGEVLSLLGRLRTKPKGGK